MQQECFARLVFGGFGQIKAKTRVNIEEVCNIRAVCCVVGRNDIIVSQDPNITKLLCDLHIDKATCSLKEYVSRDFSGHP